MKELLLVTRRQVRWASWCATLALLLALFPVAADCARGARACPMAAAAGRCACCCATPAPGKQLTTVPCAGGRAVPAPVALAARADLSPHRSSGASHVAAPTIRLRLPPRAPLVRRIGTA